MEIYSLHIYDHRITETFNHKLECHKMSTSEKIEEETLREEKVVLEIDAHPFKGLEISEDWKKLDLVENRTLCSKCNKSRKYFCYSCNLAVPEIIKIVPKVKLPIKVDIIKHAREMDGKSTAVHAAVLAPEDVTIYTYPCIPDYEADQNVVLIFPNKDAVSIEEVCRRFSKEECGEPISKRQCPDLNRFVIHRAVFIDSTWNQSRGIFKDMRIKRLPSVVLRSRLSQFWRHQADSPRWYLATIEAIHQFFVEVDKAQWMLDHGSKSDDSLKESSRAGHSASREVTELTKPSFCVVGDNIETVTLPNSNTELSSHGVEIDGKDAEEGSERNQQLKYSYNGKYDNLLFFFRFMYSKIHTLYDHENLRSYKRRLE